MTLPQEVQELIRDEEDRLKQVIQSLQSQREIAKRRLKTESERAQDFTAQIVAARRDTDKQLLASDEAVAHGLRDRKREEIQEIDRLLDRPYFARIVLAEQGEDGRPREIEFRLGTVSNTDCRIIDWRKAPISKLYYEYVEGDEYDEEIQGRERQGRIALRHKLDIEDGQLRGVSCRYGNFQLHEGVWVESRGRSRSGRSRRIGELPDVLSLITAEQFRAITKDADSAVVIQGIAGSGKTTVALHRLSWLLTPPNSDLEAGDTVILVRSKPLRAYIEQSLPSMDLAAVRCLTFDAWIKKAFEVLFPAKDRPHHLHDEELSPSIERVLRSTALLRSIDLYVSVQRERLIKHLAQLVQGNAALTARLELAGSKNLPALRIVQELENALGPARSAAGSEKIAEELASCSRRLNLYREDLHRILESHNTVLERDESKLLDAALLEEARATLLREHNAGKTGVNTAVLMLLLAALKGAVLPRYTGESKKYRHIAVDEVQDYSAPELALILEAVTELRGLTLTGDAAQAIGRGGAFPGWDALRRIRNLGDSSHFVELTVSHRSTLAIMQLADHVLGEARTKTGRPGKPPIWFACRDESDAAKEAIGWLLRVSEKYPEAVIAVLCESRETARYVYSLLRPTFAAALQLWDDGSHEFQEGILVMSVTDAKGLEFEHVLVWDPSESAYPANRLGRNRLYVAITRAEEHLCLVTFDRPARILPALNSPLVRGIEPEPEVEDDDEPQLLDHLPGDG